MKLIVDNSLYIQKIDLEFLQYYCHLLPKNVSDKIFKNPQIDLDDYSKYDFLEFSNPEDIAFFQNIDAIIDYNMIENYSNTELGEMGKSFRIELEQTAQKLYSIKESSPEYKDTLLRYKILNYKIKSLTDILDFKYGMLKFKLPTSKNRIKQLINRIIHKK